MIAFGILGVLLVVLLLRRRARRRAGAPGPAPVLVSIPGAGGPSRRPRSFFRGSGGAM